MMPADLRWIINMGVFCCAMLYLCVPSPATGISLPKIVSKSEATGERIKDIFRSLLTGDAVEQNVRIKRQEEDGNGTKVSPVPQNSTTTTTAAANVTSTENVLVTTTNMEPDTKSSVEDLNIGDYGPNSSTDLENTTVTPMRNDTLPPIPVPDTPTPTSHYTLRPPPDVNRDIVGNLPEREGEDEAIVETRPYLLHPPFTTYILIVTIPCIIGWCLLTFVCLWICRPNSPLYREILKRLIEHSQMKQKSVLFSATVLAADKHPGTQATTSGEGTSKDKA